MKEKVFEAAGITRRFGKTWALKGIDFDLEPGVVTVLLGPNGSGKTTLMQIALGTMSPTAGAMRVFGLDPMKRPREVRRETGFVPTIPDVYEWMTLNDLFKFLRPQYPRWDEAYDGELVQAFAVPRNRPFKNLSRGQAMKGMLAAALAPKPRLLLLDEPFSGLDPLAREEVLRGVICRLREEGRTVLCSTHDLNVASRLADRIIIMVQGRIKTAGTLEEVLGCEEPSRVPDRILDLLHESALEAQEVG